jgi:stage II sporulation protein M
MKKLKGEKINFKNEYKKSLRYLKQSKKFIFTIAGIFLFFAVLGFTFPLPQDIYTQLVNYLKSILSQTDNLSHFELIQFIFINNLKSTFAGIFFGAVIGLFPLFSTMANGYILGFVSSMSVSSAGVMSLWRIFPHGIFEIPAICISLGLGLKLGTFIFEKKKLKTFRDYFLNSVRVFLLVVIPLLIIAAIIEGTLIIFTK